MFKLPSFKKEQEETNKFLSININARDVKCLAFYFDGDVFKIIGSSVFDLPDGCVRNGMILDTNTIVGALKKVSDQATDGLNEPINKGIVGVEGGITTGITTTVRMKKPNLNPIQSDEIDSLYKRVEDEAYIQAKNRVFENTGDVDMDISSITTSDVYIKIDGQKALSLEGQKGQNVEIAIFNSFIPTFHIKSLHDAIKKAGLDIIAIGSQMYSLVGWIKQPPKETTDFVLINLSEDSTDVGAVFGGGITSTRTLNLGYLHFLEHIGLKMGLSRKESETILKMYNAGKLSESEISMVRSFLNEALEIWVDGLELLFDDFPGVKTFAPKVFLSGCGMEIRDISQAVKEKPWTKSIPFKEEPEFTGLSFTDTGSIINSTDKDLSTDWVYLASTSLIFREIMGI